MENITGNIKSRYFKLHNSIAQVYNVAMGTSWLKSFSFEQKRIICVSKS